MVDAGKAILVTGGAGYVGSHACKALAAAGYLPISYDDLSSGHKWAVKWGPLERGDILDRRRVAEVIERYRPMAVMHFAAFASVGESVSDPGKYYGNNVEGTLSVLKVMRETGIDRFVFSSSCATYGVPNVLPVSEIADQHPISPYGWSKLMSERMLVDFAAAYGLKSIALRYFNAAGADPAGEIGEDHDPETHLIPLVLQAAADNGRAVNIFGGDYNTPDGTCVRDYVHVSDIADAHVRALAALERVEGFAAYNLGSGEGVSVAQLVRVAERVTGKTIRANVRARRLGDPAVLVADSTAVQRDLGWVPASSDLDNIVGSAWRWLIARDRKVSPAPKTREPAYLDGPA